MNEALRLAIGVFALACAAVSFGPLVHAGPIETCIAATKVKYEAYDDRTVFPLCDYETLKSSDPSDEQAWTIIEYFWNRAPGDSSEIILVPWVKPLAQRGDSKAISKMASMERDPEKKIALYALAARRGNLDAEEYLYRYLLANPRIVPDSLGRADQLLAEAAQVRHPWALEKMREKNIQARANSTDRNGDALLALLGLLVVAAVASGGDQQHTAPKTPEFDPCAGAKDTFAWSGEDMDVAAAIALGGCSPF